MSKKTDNPEFQAKVCELLCNHRLRVAKIAKRLGVSKTTIYEVIYTCLAGSKESQPLLRFHPPHERVLSERIENKYPRLRGVTVVHAAWATNVAMSAAEMLLRLVTQHAAKDPAEVHVGFAGGYITCELARHFAGLLRRPGADLRKTGDLPKSIAFHSLGGAFDISTPTTDPNAFFTYLTEDAEMPVKTRFVGLRAPAVVNRKMLRTIQNWEEFKQAKAQTANLDIVVTLGACWADEHNLLRKYMEGGKNCIDLLTEAGCVGDMLWCPIGPDGPLNVETDLCTVTLLRLDDLQGLIKGSSATDVLLVLGPCGEPACRRPKTETLKAILEMTEHLVTHLVVDSRTAQGLFEKPTQKGR